MVLLSIKVDLLFYCIVQTSILGTSLAILWLRLRSSTAEGAGSIPGRGTKMPKKSHYFFFSFNNFF